MPWTICGYRKSLRPSRRMCVELLPTPVEHQVVVSGGTVPEEATVTVAALTFRRPAEIARLLPLLVAQAAQIEPPARVLIVDNDPDGSAEAEVRRWHTAGVDYAHEPRPGISAGRNRALHLAGDCDAVVFIDDDETPLDGWLRGLVETWRAERSAAVGGPVIRDLEDLDPWIRATGLFDPRQFPTGTRVYGGATNNLLLDVRFLRAHGLRFDERFGLTGGSDTVLLKSILRCGGEIVWCDEAAVVDHVPTDRLTRDWVRRRFFRTGNTWTRAELALASSGSARLRVRLDAVARAGLRMLRGCVLLTAGLLVGGTAWHARGVAHVCTGAGSLLAGAGGQYVEYRR